MIKFPPLAAKGPPANTVQLGYVPGGMIINASQFTAFAIGQVSIDTPGFGGIENFMAVFNINQDKQLNMIQDGL